MLHAFATMINAAEKIQLTLFKLFVKVVALCTLIAPTPDATFDADIAVGLLADFVLACTRQPIVLVSFEALIADQGAPQAAVLAELDLTYCTLALARDSIEGKVLIASIADAGTTRRALGTLLDQASFVEACRTILASNLLKKETILALVATLGSTNGARGTVTH